ncbi:hypothetical protein J5N97_006253 [Dioscorea zingiberensis]|uniref:Plant heme peroxidase family profile domain-containing protein n=1 Tax=Dioscorea zingiberensis TaxID=325984 RepID=A0A9D5DC20_9LILI|nr:hypothetical protein J5N97_006253 [Dioscorea zingiberensis]
MAGLMWLIICLLVDIIIAPSAINAQGTTGLQTGFYSSTCPKAESTVRSTVEKYRLYNFTATGNADPSISQAFLGQLQALCPQNGDGSKRVALDKDSMTTFDVSFFKNVRDGNGVLESDQRLWEDATTHDIVRNYAGNFRGLLGLRFEFEFRKSMVKMSSIAVKTGTQGEIRKLCSKFN